MPRATPTLSARSSGSALATETEKLSDTAILTVWSLAAGKARQELAPEPVPGAPEGLPDAVPSPVPTDSQSAALIAMRATTAAGNPLSGRQLETRFGLSSFREKA